MTSEAYQPNTLSKSCLDPGSNKPLTKTVMRQLGNLNIDGIFDEIHYSFFRNDGGTVFML